VVYDKFYLHQNGNISFSEEATLGGRLVCRSSILGRGSCCLRRCCRSEPGSWRHTTWRCSFGRLAKHQAWPSGPWGSHAISGPLHLWSWVARAYRGSEGRQWILWFTPGAVGGPRDELQSHWLEDLSDGTAPGKYPYQFAAAGAMFPARSHFGSGGFLVSKQLLGLLLLCQSCSAASSCNAEGRWNFEFRAKKNNFYVPLLLMQEVAELVN